MQDFYDQLHKALAEKHNTSVGIIATVRSQALHSKMSREDTMDWMDEKILAHKKSHLQPRKKWLDVFKFLENLSDEAYADITQKTQYDK